MKKQDIVRLKKVHRVMMAVLSVLIILSSMSSCFADDIKIEKHVVIPYEVYESAFHAAAIHKVDVEYILAMILVENRDFDRYLRSKTKDSGMTQINDALLRDFYACGFGNVYDLDENIEFGTMRLMWAYNSTEDWHMAYMIYNMGGPRAKRLFKKGITRSRYSRKCMKYLKIKKKWKIKDKDGRLYSMKEYNVLMWD